MTSSINIIGDYGYNHSQVLHMTTDLIQKTFDISPKLINQWMNRTNFKDEFFKLDETCYKQVMEHDHELLNKLLDVAHPETFVEEYMPWERERCGQILEEFSNGYIKYCNQHRYLHPCEADLHSNGGDIGEDGESGKNMKKDKRPETDFDHSFVSKSNNDIVDEKIFNLRFNLYVDYTRHFARTLMEQFVQYLEENQKYQKHYVAEENFNQLIDWLKKHETDFREKQPTYEGTVKLVKVYLEKNDENKPVFDLL